MDYLTSHDVTGPIVRIRPEKFWVRHDPTGLRRDQRYDFEIEVAEAVSLTAQASVWSGASELKHSQIYQDWSVMGECRHAAAKQADVFEDALFGAGLDIVVTVKAEWKAVVFDPENAPFYSGTVRCFTVPYRWRRDDGGPTLHPREQVFEVYRNGGRGKDADAFVAFVSETKAMDAAQHLRRPWPDGSKEVR